MDEKNDKACPGCGQDVDTTEDVCPMCGYDLEEVHEEEVEELLTEIDDDTYEIKSGNSDAILEKIKHFAPKDEVSRKVKEKKEKKELVFECPLCGTEVHESETKCPGCGAIFED